MNNKPSLTGFAIILSLGLIITGFIIGNTWKKVSRGSVTITVTGSASKNIRSDLAEWQGSYSNEASTMTEAYSKLTASSDKVKNYLVQKMIKENKVPDYCIKALIDVSYIKWDENIEKID